VTVGSGVRVCVGDGDNVGSGVGEGVTEGVIVRLTVDIGLCVGVSEGITVDAGGNGVGVRVRGG